MDLSSLRFDACRLNVVYGAQIETHPAPVTGFLEFCSETIYNVVAQKCLDRSIILIAFLVEQHHHTCGPRLPLDYPVT